eukprot:7023210-Pyramimonas_sp.AAC.1
MAQHRMSSYLFNYDDDDVDADYYDYASQEALNAQQHAVERLLSEWSAVGGQQSAHECQQNAAVLCDAASEGDINRVQLMLENKADPNMGDYDNRTPLHLASAQGHHKVVSALLVGKADPHTKDRWGAEPMQDAIKNKQATVVGLLRDEGVGLPSNQNSTTSLCDAASKGDVETIRLLRLCGVDLNSHDYDGRSALMLACAEGHVPTVFYLLYAGAIPNKRDRWGGTALNDAVRAGSSLACHLLKAFGGELGRILPAGSPPTLEFVKLAVPIANADRTVSGPYDARVVTPGDLPAEALASNSEA